eukprot:scaffold259653_cov18-Tisochrysis_lutea.AAC.1
MHPIPPHNTHPRKHTSSAPYAAQGHATPAPPALGAPSARGYAGRAPCTRIPGCSGCSVGCSVGAGCGSQRPRGGCGCVGCAVGGYLESRPAAASAGRHPPLPPPPSPAQ